LPIDRTPLTAIFTVDYRLAELRALLGEDQYQNWASLRPQLGQPTISRFDFDFAVERLSQLPQASRYRRHAQGAVAMTIVAAARAQHGPLPGTWSPDSIHELARRTNLISDSILDSLRAGPELDAAYAAAAFAGAPCRLLRLSSSYSYDEFAVTTASVEADFNVSIARLKRTFDPRLWDVRAAENFEQADQIPKAERATRVPGSPGKAPPPRLPDEAAEQAIAGTPWKGFLYENFVVASGSSSLVDFKNILSIVYEIDDVNNPTVIALTYWLSESLSFEIGTSGTMMGGLDRDSGTAEVIALSGAETRVKASKSIRITQPPNGRNTLNADMAGSVPFWLRCAVVLGVCDNLDP
jgi:hypothetical protein